MASSEPDKLGKCKVGLQLDEICHRTIYCRKVGFHDGTSFTEHDKKILQWRCGVAVFQQDQVCFHHEKLYLSRYESLQKFCCDPLRMHKTHITKSLRVVTEETAERLQLKPGQKLCPSCVKRFDEIEESIEKVEDLDTGGSTEEEFQEPASLALGDINKVAETLHCTPVRSSIGIRDRLAYGKRKSRQLGEAVKAHCAKALLVDIQNIESDAELEQCQRCSDCETLISLLKDKVKISSRQEKVKLLTLAPDSWSREKVMNEFCVTEHLVRKARQLKKDRGILAEPDAKQGRRLDAAVVERVVEFYQSDEHSRMCPGKKEFVTIKVNDRKEQKQKRLLLINLKELHIEFLRKNPTDVLSFAKFCELRPKWCVPVTAAGMHSVCVCEQHQNAKLLVAATPDHNDYKAILEKVVCDTNNRTCMLHLCEACPGAAGLRDYLSEVFSSHEFDLDDEISFKQWSHVDRTTLVSVRSSVEDFIQTVCEHFDGLRQHHFIAKAQSSYLSLLKENLVETEAVVLLDFAENYTFLVQDAIQSHHWNNSQATLHPFVIYHKSEGTLRCISMCIISDCLKHDTIAVHAFLTVVCKYIKSTLPLVKKLVYYSDGSASQYKNIKNFCNLCMHWCDHGLEAEWHFFATSHGKSPCDGIGGTVKRLVARASLQATMQNHILTAEQMFEYANSNIEGIKFFYVTAADVHSNYENFDLGARFASLKTIAGTRSHHCFIPVSMSEISMKRVSADTIHDVVRIGTPVPDQILFEEYQPGKYVACIYDREWYVGLIEERSEEYSDVRINFMKKITPGLFSWPPSSRKDQCWVPFQHLVCLISAPQVTSQNARSYKLSDHDVETINKKLSSFL